MEFLVVSIVINHLHSALSSCASLGCCDICHLERSFTLSPDATNDHNGSSVPLYHTHTHS